MFRIAGIGIFLELFLQETYAQNPTSYPTPDTEPIDINFVNILVYFIMPVLMVIIYVWTKKLWKKKQEEEKQNESNNI